MSTPTTKPVTTLFQDARFRIGALLTLLGASGVALIMNQDSCTIKIVPTATDAGITATADSGVGEGEGESVGQ